MTVVDKITSTPNSRSFFSSVSAKAVRKIPMPVAGKSSAPIAGLTGASAILMPSEVYISNWEKPHAILNNSSTIPISFNARKVAALKVIPAPIGLSVSLSSINVTFLPCFLS